MWLFDFPVTTIAAPVAGIVVGIALGVFRGSGHLKTVLLVAGGLGLFASSLIWEGIRTHPVRVPSWLFGMASVTVFIIITMLVGAVTGVVLGRDDNGEES